VGIARLAALSDGRFRAAGQFQDARGASGVVSSRPEPQGDLQTELARGPKAGPDPSHPHRPCPARRPAPPEIRSLDTHCAPIA
jgi:hypothetical protein